MTKKATDDDAQVELANGKFKEKDGNYEKSLKAREVIEYFATFNACPQIIQYNKNLNFEEKQILWAIYLHTNNPKNLDGWDACRPSQTTLANFCNRARQRLRPYLDSLITKGYVIEEKRKNQTSRFFITGKLALDLIQNSNLIRKSKRSEIQDLCALIPELIEIPKGGVVSTGTTKLSQRGQPGLSQRGHELDSIPDLDLNSELELKGTHTRGKNSASKNINGKRRGKGDLSDSTFEKTDKTPPTPPSSQNESVKKSVIERGDVQIKRKGEKVMTWDKKGKKGGFSKTGGVDNTEGLAISKSSQTRRTPDPKNEKGKTTKWTRLVNEIQTTFKQKALTHEGGILSSGAQHRQLADMVKNLGGLADTKAVIEYAIEHWDELRSQDKKLLSKPNLNNMLVDWRYLEWKDMMKLETQRVELPKNRQETPIKQVKLTAVK